MRTVSGNEQELMRKCLDLAKRGRGRVSPNPLVGALLVRNGRILARGYHRRFGGPHAEVECIRAHHGSFSGTTLFVNLEPCAHTGKTPPCTDLILSKRIPRVIIAMRDPNPVVAGRGIARLRRGGVSVTVGVLGEEARELNREFVTHIVRGWPHVHMKVAQTLDGMIAPLNGRRVWISSPASRRKVHRWRASHDAVMVGAGTILADDPFLDTRLVRGRNPDVVILDGSLSTPVSARIFGVPDRRVILCVREDILRRKTGKVSQLAQHGARFIPIAGRSQLLKTLLKNLYRQNIGSLLVEGGGRVFNSFMQQSLVDRLSIFIAPDLMGKGTRGITLRRILRSAPADAVVAPSGRDLLIEMHYGGA